MGAEAAGRRPFPGSTAALVLVAGGLLAVANLGDSRAVLCHGGQVGANACAQRLVECRHTLAAYVWRLSAHPRHGCFWALYGTPRQAGTSCDPPQRPCLQALALTRDQTADREDERRRVEAAGGTVSHMLGGWRVGAVGMQVTR